MVMKFTMETNHTIEKARRSSKGPGPGRSFGRGMEKCVEIVKPFLIRTRMLRSAGLGYGAVNSGTSEEPTASFAVGIESNVLFRSSGSCLLNCTVP